MWKCVILLALCITVVSSDNLFFKLLGEKKTSVSNVECPGGHTACYPGSTCCDLGGGSYGCCPAVNAVCCADKQHCCPNGLTCTNSGCVYSDGTRIMSLLSTFTKAEVKSVNNKATNEQKTSVSNVMCPNGQSYCPSGNTCCKLGYGEYGCCPVPNAVCCDDMQHCCPEGYSCLTGTGQCAQADGTRIMAFTKTSAKKSVRAKQKTSVSNVMCPNGQSYCPSGNTCCKLGYGEYGCCPVPNAVCCDDMQHCCPEGYSCLTGTGQCAQADGTRIMAFTKTSAKKSVRAKQITKMEKLQFWELLKNILKKLI